MSAAAPDRRTHDEVDAVVIGAGAGGAPLLARLAASGLRVVPLKAGKEWAPALEYATDERAMADLFWADERLSAGADPLAFGRNNSGTGLGGSTLHYTAFTPRAPSAHGFRSGQSVFHTKFGEGVILTLEGQGDEARAQVNFGRHGAKWLQLDIAKLTLVT